MTPRGYEIWRALIAPDVGDPAPGTVRLEVANQARILEQLAAPVGRVKLLYVWASWCEPCLTDLRFLAALARRTRGLPLDIVTVSADSPTDRETALEQLGAAGATTQNYWLHGISPGDFADGFDPQWPGSLPYAAVLTPDGEWVFRAAGTLDAAKLEARVRAALPSLEP